MKYYIRGFEDGYQNTINTYLYVLFRDYHNGVRDGYETRGWRQPLARSRFSKN